MRTTFLPLALGLVIVLTGCALTSETARPHFDLVDDDSARRIGEKIYRAELAAHRLSADSRLTATVNTIGRRLAAVATRPDYEWEFSLIENDAVDAFCLPGGKVGVYTGLLPVAVNETGLATAIAHEIGHAVAAHGTERFSQKLLAGAAEKLLSLGISRNDALQALFRQSFGMERGDPYRLFQEKEADYLGLIYMARAGYDPREAIGFWKRLDTNGRGDRFESTHPPTAERLEALKKRLPKALLEYAAAPRRHGKGNDLF